ncbi:S8 family serine peptidase [Rothia kristinae]|uniref:S8 family serine peptidase n=1 Tax=Rothia kristinae TaxID=37923 RepID=UPI003436F657
MSPRFLPGSRRSAKACAAAALGLTLALSSGLPAFAETIQGSAPDDTSLSAGSSSPVLADDVAQAHGNIAVYVQLKGVSAFEATQAGGRVGGELQNRASQVQAIAGQVQATGQQMAGDSGSQVLYTTHNALRGVAMQGDADQIKKLAERDDVQRISKIIPKERVNAGADVDTGAASAWENPGVTGKDVTIAVIDTGLDYTHADFGGPGTQEAYAKAKDLKTFPTKDSGLIDPNKVISGYDLAGDAYDARLATSVPQPDANPLDCKAAGHGTHVAGTAGGYGVTKDGKTFTGDYSKLTADEVKAMKIGPGTAPEAKLTSLRVFGCEGSTNLVGAALDRTLDPNGDGDYSDAAQIASISIGSDFGIADDPENDIVNALNRAGVLSVIAAGNAGDSYDVAGSPGSATSALTVANSIGSTVAVDQAEVLAPEDVKGDVTGSYSQSFDYTAAKPEQLEGTVTTVPEANKYGCQPFTGQDFAGKWVYLDWADDATGQYPCGSKVRFDNAQNAGAKGVVLTSDVTVEDAGIAGNSGIPGIRLDKASADKVDAAAKAGTLRIKVGPGMIGAGRVDSGSQDYSNASTSRGEHGSAGYTKPDVAAPGTSIASAGVGSGNGIEVMTGTSMATPHTSGVAALVWQKHRNYTPQNVKAAIMNTATHDVKNANGTTESVERVGSGRVDAVRAVNQDVIVYNADRPDIVSQSFGVTEAKTNGGVQRFTRKITVDNIGNRAHTYVVSFAGTTQMPGVSFSYDPTVSVGSGGKATITVTATVDPKALVKTQDPAQAKIQLGKARQYIGSLSGRLVLSENGQDLRLPLQIAPKPVSDMKVDANAIEFKDAKTAQTQVSLAGTALNQGGYRSALGAFELGASSPRLQSTSLPAPSTQALDLQYVGTAVKDGKLAIGISTWGNLVSVMPSSEFQVLLDTDGNGRPDWVVVTTRATGLDYPLVGLVRVVGNSLQRDGAGNIVYTDQQPLNGSWGDTDTNTMDTNAIVLPVDLTKMGLDPAQKDLSISYAVSTFSYAQSDAIDSTDAITFKPNQPKVAFDSSKRINSVLLSDEPGTLSVTRGSAEDAQALFLHLHNGTGDLSGIKQGEDGGRAQVLTVKSGKTEVVENPRFKDVPTSYPFYNEIAWLATKKITTGWPDGTYRPSAPVERGQMAAFLYRMAGSPAYTPPSKSPFKDVSTNYVFYKEISWLASQGITTGWPDGTFRPSASVERGQMAAFMYRMAGSPAYTPPAKSPFKDVSTNYVFYRQVAWMNDQKIAKGWNDGTFRPSASVERGQMAAFLYRYDHEVLGNR